MIRPLGALAALALAVLPLAGGALPSPGERLAVEEVVVTLRTPPLGSDRTAAHRAALDREQQRFAVALRTAVPQARIHWRYRIVLNGAAVALPTRAVPLLSRLPGVKSVDAGARYAVASISAAGVRKAQRRWQAGLPNRGDGIKIGIIDDGIDQRHPYFSPAGYSMPPGFPKGQAAYTTAKVIVARAFAPAGTTYANAGKPYDAGQSEHATHVAGIAAGNAGTNAGSTTVSGVAPRAYLGNYKALAIPTDADVGLDGNAAEIVAAIEAAVSDGMNVINLSIGEPEIEPSRDLVAIALDGAARAGVIPVVAAGNDFEEFGKGSLSSPGSTALAITVAAVTIPDSGGTNIASFSSSGPTPLSLRLKPDVSAPGVSILSSLPGGRWASWSGTSMASPQVSGAAALLRERHPTWSVADVKAALMSTGSTVKIAGLPAPPTRGGGGLVDPVKADVPLVTASPPSLSFGLLRPGTTVPGQVQLADSGGAGTWDVAVEPIAATAGASLTVPPTVSVPGTLAVSAVVAPSATDGDLSGFIRLTRGADIRRVPFWLHVAKPALAGARPVSLPAPGQFKGTTRGKRALVSRYRYPEIPAGGPMSSSLAGPEQVFRFKLVRPVANFGVVITRRADGVRVEPRVVAAGDENRLQGYAALPIYLNPYLAQLGAPVLAAGALRPKAGSYDIVFDSASAAGAGAFSFRFWVDDTRPPTVRLVATRLRRGSPVLMRVSDAGSGVDPQTAIAKIDGRGQEVTWKAGTLRVSTQGLFPGTHRLRLQISDYQESRNNENVPPILPNTRIVNATIAIR